MRRPPLLVHASTAPLTSTCLCLYRWGQCGLITVPDPILAPNYTPDPLLAPNYTPDLLLAPNYCPRSDPGPLITLRRQLFETLLAHDPKNPLSLR